jgi:hypothetical protein
MGIPITFILVFIIFKGKLTASRRIPVCFLLAFSRPEDLFLDPEICLHIARPCAPQYHAVHFSPSTIAHKLVGTARSAPTQYEYFKTLSPLHFHKVRSYFICSHFSHQHSQHTIMQDPHGL